MLSYNPEYLRWLIIQYRDVSGDPTIFCTDLPNNETNIINLIEALSKRSEQDRETYTKAAEVVVNRIQNGKIPQHLREEIWFRKNIIEI